MPGPFDGVRILDLSLVVSGPLCTMLMADQGAQVTKVEPISGQVDVTRMPAYMKANLSALFVNNNRGKRAITLDLTQDDGRAILLELAARSDVVVQNFRPGAVERLGIAYDDLRKVNPKIIYASISGYGPTGPYSDRPVYDPIIQGLAGMVSRQVNPQVPIPDLVRNLIADKTTALTAAQAISAALFHRERTGEGQHITIPMIDAFLYFFWPDGMMDQTLLDDDASGGFLLSTIYSLTETSDGRVIYFTASDVQRQNLFRALGHPEWLDDPRFSTLEEMTKPENIETLGGLITSAFLGLTTEQAMEQMLANDVPCGAILDTSEIGRDPQIVHNGSIEVWEHPQAGKIQQPRPAARFSQTPADIGRSAPQLGEHNDEVLTELGRTADQIAKLRADGIVG